MEIIIWIGILFCLSQSAMFSGLNLAFFSLSRLHLEMESKRNDKNAKIKSPYRITLSDERLFSIAGLWESYTDEDENSIYSFTIITTTANEQVAPLHDRMPVILTEESEKKWLNDDLDTSEHRALLKPYESEALKTYQVSTMVNSAKNDTPDLILAKKDDPPGGTLSLFN